MEKLGDTYDTKLVKPPQVSVNMILSYSVVSAAIQIKGELLVQTTSLSN